MCVCVCVSLRRRLCAFVLVKLFLATRLSSSLAESGREGGLGLTLMSHCHRRKLVVLMAVFYCRCCCCCYYCCYSPCHLGPYVAAVQQEAFVKVDYSMNECVSLALPLSLSLGESIEPP